MSASTYSARRLLIIDDDAMSREILLVYAAGAGFEAESYPSGEMALVALRAADAQAPEAVLCDMQMPGISGAALASALRAACPSSTTLFAMSASAVAPEERSGFDHFLLKPFRMEEVATALDASLPADEPDRTIGTEVLGQAIYDAFARSLTPDQLDGLYAMSLEDADRRIGGMRIARAAGEDDAYRRAAHAIKGGCGMVGATELARLAAHMEDHGAAAEEPHGIDHIDPLDQFLEASANLRRILDAKRK